MRLLLDTHVVIWALLDSPRLSAKASELIMAGGNEVFVSAVSIWDRNQALDRQRRRAAFHGI